MQNTRVAAVFDEIADILDIQGDNPFRVRSYRNAARAIRDLPEQLEDLAGSRARLRELPDVGESIAEQIQEMVRTGRSRRLEEVREGFPPGLDRLLRVRGLGPRKVKLINRELGVSSLAELERAAREGEIRGLPGMGARTEEKILQGLESLQRDEGRFPLGAADRELASVERQLSGLEGIEEWAAAGSLRRRRETIGDLDILVVPRDRELAAEQILHLDGIEDVEARGEEKLSVRLAGGLRVDFRFISRASFGAALLYFTGSKAHGVALRKRALKKGWKVSEYGLFDGRRRLAGRSEAEMYERLGMAYVPPELREDRGEVEAAAEGRLPRLVGLDDIQGDLHAHTRETDGRHTIEEMAAAARERGYRYLAITNHTRALPMAGGLDGPELRAHAAELREHDRRREDLWLLAGVEVDILRDGELDIERAVLEELDLVIASVHSHFELDEEAMTERLLRAVESGVVDCLGHPTGRELGKREAMRFDLERVIRACVAHDVALEVNGHPERLDLPDVQCRRAAELGAKLLINTDAHKTGDLDLMHYGVSVARRGWVESGNVLNTRSAEELRGWLRFRRGGGSREVPG